MGKWKPIDTAPKDGTKILGWFPKPWSSHPGVSACKWVVDSRWLSGGAWDSRQNGFPPPTHWMELPEPPND